MLLVGGFSAPAWSVRNRGPGMLSSSDDHMNKNISTFGISGGSSSYCIGSSAACTCSSCSCISGSGSGKSDSSSDSSTSGSSSGSSSSGGGKDSTSVGSAPMSRRQRSVFENRDLCRIISTFIRGHKNNIEECYF